MNIYVINRSDRPQRLSDVREELSSQNLNAHVFSAVIAKPGWVGCTESHLAIMEKCKGEKTYMILEDDVRFRFANIMWWVSGNMEALPSDWDCLYLGGSPQEPQEKYSDKLFRARHVKCTHAIVWNNRPNGAVEYILSHRSDIKKIDVYLANVIQMNFNCFLARPLLATQHQYLSDTCKKSDVSTIITNYFKYCK